MKRDSKHAFITLIELLVLVPVAALLTTMLFAVSNDAKQQLQAAACLNNMRQWSLGFMLYANDHNDYYPYDGSPVSPCATVNTNAWFNVVPQYIGQQSLCQLYAAGTPPTPLTKSVWSCPSSTNVTVQPTMSSPVFYYSMNLCWHEQGSTSVGYRRNRMMSPRNTILFCEEQEDVWPNQNGGYDLVTRHFGGSNFVFGDGHADWIHFTNFCRMGNANICPPPLGEIDSYDSTINADWNPAVPYHWWPFLDAGTGAY